MLARLLECRRRDFAGMLGLLSSFGPVQHGCCLCTDVSHPRKVRKSIVKAIQQRRKYIKVPAGLSQSYPFLCAAHIMRI